MESRFYLSPEFKNRLKSQKENFGSVFGEAVYYRTYSRSINGIQEKWADTVLRVVEGVLSIHLDYHNKHHLAWDVKYYTGIAHKMAQYMFDMKFLPAGRGLWAMGTDQVYNKGSAALYNCAATKTDNICEDACWTMDMLMNGCGVGARLPSNNVNITMPIKNTGYVYCVDDSREGWVRALFYLLNSYYSDKKGRLGQYHTFDFSLIRPAGQQLKTFGGISSGSQPLIDLLRNVENVLDRRVANEITHMRCVADIINFIGCCVVAGNIRRSSEILMIDSQAESYNEFLDLKNYNKNPERMNFGYMSNNSVVLSQTKEFSARLPEIAQRIKNNGEPGFMNLLNIQKYGRYGQVKEDKADMVNPCGEIALEHRETCNLSEVFPTRTSDLDDFLTACKLATFYCKTISLLPTHHKSTNTVIARNRRIGVSISGVTEFMARYGMATVIKYLRAGYRCVDDFDIEFSSKSGIPVSIRKTTIKPSGSISQLVGVPSGMHFPTFEYAIRRMRVSTNSKICDVLKRAKVPNEVEYYRTVIGKDEEVNLKLFGATDANTTIQYQEDKKIVTIYHPETTVFEFPIAFSMQRPALQVSAWEQFALLATMQREWSDNLVSCSIYFTVQEQDQVEHMLSMYAPVIKSVSMLPHSDAGKYPQMPYEGTSKEEYLRRKEEISGLDWSLFTGSQGDEPKFCTGDRCELY